METESVPNRLASRMALLRLLADAGSATTAALAVALVVDALVPSAVALTLAALVGHIAHVTGTIGAAVIVPVVGFGAVILAGNIAEIAIDPLQFQATSRINGRHRARVVALTAAPVTIEALERPDVQAMIREVEADPQHGFERSVGEGATAQLQWLAGLAGVAALAVVLIRYAWWLPVLLLVPAAINRQLRNRQNYVLARLWQDAMRRELHADVWRKAAIAPGEAKDVRMFGIADWMVQRMQEHISVANAPLWRYVNRIVAAEWSQFALIAVGLVPAYLAVTLSAVDSRTSIAMQTAVLTAGAALYQALGYSEIGYQVAGAVEVLDTTRRLREALVATGPPASDTGPEPGLSADRAPLISFERVSFAYPGSETPVLEHLDLQIRPGELLAIVGLNGAGKTTLIKLLACLYHVTGGRITADGTDIWHLPPQQWRAQLSVVFQDFSRYQLSAADNIVLGRGGISRDDKALLDAARDAGFTEIAAGLPDAWDTPLSRSCDGGVDLSGGQWQQVALARALYAVRLGARVLILDEPTAHLDVRIEYDIFQRLAAHRGRASVVLITHRLATARRADRIALLGQGRVVETGTHDDLMAAGGEYAKMFTIQAERFARGYQDRIEEGDLR